MTSFALIVLLFISYLCEVDWICCVQMQRRKVSMNLCTSGKYKSSSHGFFFFLGVCKVKNLGFCPWKLHWYLQSEGIGNFMVEVGRRLCRRLTPEPTSSFHLSNVAFLGCCPWLGILYLYKSVLWGKFRYRAWINTVSCRINLNLHVSWYRKWNMKWKNSYTPKLI